MSRMYRVAVCEDEKNLREDLCAQCAAILSELQIEHTVTPYSSAEELEAAFSAGAEFSLLCLDILMDGKTGMKLAQELRQQGVDADAITAAMEQTEPEIDRARAVWQRKFGEAPADYKEKARQIRFLAARGFSFDVISKILSEAGSSADEDDFS